MEGKGYDVKTPVRFHRRRTDLAGKRGGEGSRLRAAAVACTLAVLGAGGVAALAGAPAGAASPPVTIGYENNGADPEMVAIAQGMFARAMHTRVSLRYFASGPASLAALASGSLDFMTGIGNPPVVSALAQGVPLQVIWAQERYTRDEGLVVRKAGGPQSIRALRGKDVAIVLGSTSPFELDTELGRLGMPDSSVHLLNMTPAAMVAAWRRGDIDAAYVWDPAFDSMLHLGGRALMYDQTVESTAPIFNLAVVNTAWGKAHPVLVEGFVRAEQEAVSFYRTHPGPAIQDMAREAGIPVSLARSELAGYALYDLPAQLGTQGLGTGKGVAGSLVTRSLTSAAAYLYRTGTLTHPLTDAARFVNPTYAQAALRSSTRGG